MTGMPSIGVVILAASFLAACSPGDEPAEEQMADTTASTSTTSNLNGTWNMRAVPESGDTTPTIFQVQVADGNWTMMLPNRDPISATVAMDGDSIMVDAGPYESVRRPGVTVTTHSVYRQAGDELVGTTIARYQNAGADSVLRLRSTGTRAQ